MLVSSSVELVGDHEAGQLPVFDGVENVVDIVGTLCRRPEQGRVRSPGAPDPARAADHLSGQE